MRVAAERVRNFFFPARDDRWLSILRIGVGLQLIGYCLSAFPDWNPLRFRSPDRLISRDLAELVLSAESAAVPRLGWLISIGRYCHLSEPVVVAAVWVLLLLAGVCLLAGAFSRSSAVAAWFLHLCTVKSEALTSYGMDNFTTIALFYLMLSPLPDRLSFDQRIRGRPAKDPQLYGFARRVLQLHLCLVYFFSGLTKAPGPEWWNGDSIWRALIRPPFNMISAQTLLPWRGVLPLLGLGVCLLETGYLFFIWPRRTRPLWLAGILAMHIGIGLAMGLYLFAWIMIVLNLAAFAPGLRARVMRSTAPA